MAFLEPDKIRNTLRKGEKLRHRSLVNTLFSKGSSLYDYPLRLIWRSVDSDTLDKTFRNHAPQGIDSLQMLITVPKKKRKKAVDRVLMRRRIREAYRLNRHSLKKISEQQGIRTLSMAFIYLHNENMPYCTIEKKMKNLLCRLAGSLSEREGSLAVSSNL